MMNANYYNINQLNQLSKSNGHSQEDIDFNFLVEIYNTMNLDKDHDLISEYMFDIVQSYMIDNQFEDPVDINHHNEFKQHVLVIIDEMRDFMENHGFVIDLIINCEYELNKVF